MIHRLSGLPVVAFVHAGGDGSAMAERAKSFADRIGSEFDTCVIGAGGSRTSATGRILRNLFARRPTACYVLDIAAAGVAATGMYQAATGTPFVIDTGDAVVELGRALGRGAVGMTATRGLEAFALRRASRVVVRGSHHQDLLVRRGIQAEFIPDGVAVDQFARRDDTPFQDSRRALTIGLVGSCVWIPNLQTCYGWDLIELIELLRNRLPGLLVCGLIIGDGSGIEVLRRRSESRGIADRIEFVGRVPYAELPGWLGRMDICLSTQTNDVIGNVRTTGKLPLYLAAGRFVLASRVGEASRILPPEMLVEFRGTVDPEYPSRLADRLIQLMDAGTEFTWRPDCVALARAHFDYSTLAPRVSSVIRDVLAPRRS